MKKSLIINLLLLLVCLNAFSQKVIENPDYGYSTVPGKLTKIEILEDTTVLHFHIKYRPGHWIFIPKETFIKNVDSDEKLFVTKTEGIPFAERYYMPESGEVNYKLYFPKLDKSINEIDFGEANEGGTWFTYSIVINENDGVLRMPKPLRGNWMLTDGSNDWHYGFYSKKAIIDKQVWYYKSIKKKGKKYTIILEKGDQAKTVYAKGQKNGRVAFGESPKTLQNYSLEKIYNPDYKLANNSEYEAPVLDLKTTKYSGIIKNFTADAGQKTATLYVNNTFFGRQDSHLIKIADDGSFSVEFPITHALSIFVRMPSGAFTVFVEPGKETFHCIDGKESFFTGDCAHVNSDLQALKFINYYNHQEARKNIRVTSPEDYKKMCLDVRDKELKALEDYASSHFVSAKGYQLKKLDIELKAYQNVLDYSMLRRSLKYQNKKAKSEDKKKPFKEFWVNKSYYDFLSEDIINNKQFLLTGEYYFFVNRLIYAEIFETQLSAEITLVEFADWLQKNNKELTAEELEMIEMSKQIETPEVMKKKELFRKTHGKVEQAFYKKHQKQTKAYKDYVKENNLKPKHSHFLLNIVEYLKDKEETLSDEELKMIEALKVMKTKEEYERDRVFDEAYGKVRGQFYEKYLQHYSDMSSDRYYSTRFNKIKSFLGKPDGLLLYDIIRMQEAMKKLNDYKVYTGDELAVIQTELKDPFLAKYLDLENEKVKREIELNKTKGGYTVNKVNRTEGDELFDAMLEKFKGKVVYVDFWATWCGPCKSSIKKIKPLKEEMKGDDVVFLYITNQTSPKNTWKNSIANIKGEHYRVTADEWNYLTEKFNISGIPHYVLVNKQGRVVNPKVGHKSNRELKTIFKAEIQK
ncbi:TlpA family protein disulfide reductase [Flavivirga eckloniae]|uniref:Thioredoxin domain-containing protein n=1 Tax=Flavivirga eckloniae TaxID=1803846 RepID=A0A2K9PNM5_9FLAO|nr:TlpA disulfide reductase family protein [Flavivirga eckloniae]AUP78659.1 hypothetical protein C1H87_08040 [Flavivirga eckloniae]